MPYSGTEIFSDEFALGTQNLGFRTAIDWWFLELVSAEKKENKNPHSSCAQPNSQVDSQNHITQ